jgi:hypothetical protein
MRRLPGSQARLLMWPPYTAAVDEVGAIDPKELGPMSTSAHAPADTAPLRSYLFVLASRTGGGAPILHCVLEESPDRAIQVCDQEHPGRRIVAVRDVTDAAAAA